MKLVEINQILEFQLCILLFFFAFVLVSFYEVLG